MENNINKKLRISNIKCSSNVQIPKNEEGRNMTASNKVKKETVEALDAMLAEFGHTLPCNFSKRMFRLSDIYFHEGIPGINMWQELCSIASRAERDISSIEETKREITTLRNFIVLNLFEENLRLKQNDKNNLATNHQLPNH